MNAGRPQRKALRLPSFDYTSAGAYFVTICTYDRSPLLEVTVLAEIVRIEWQALAGRFSSIRLDEFVVMPNHVHFVIWLVGAPLAGARDGAAAENAASAQDEPLTNAPSTAEATSNNDGTPRAPARGAPTLSAIVGAYKSLVAAKWLAWIKECEPERSARLWQRNYYEHVIRNDYELNRIRQYIRLNPTQWLLDAENPERRPDKAYEKEWGWIESSAPAKHPL